MKNTLGKWRLPSHLEDSCVDFAGRGTLWRAYTSIFEGRDGIWKGQGSIFDGWSNASASLQSLVELEAAFSLTEKRRFENVILQIRGPTRVPPLGWCVFDDSLVCWAVPTNFPHVCVQILVGICLPTTARGRQGKTDTPMLCCDLEGAKKGLVEAKINGYPHALLRFGRRQGRLMYRFSSVGIASTRLMCRFLSIEMAFGRLMCRFLSVEMALGRLMCRFLSVEVALGRLMCRFLSVEIALGRLIC